MVLNIKMKWLFLLSLFWNFREIISKWAFVFISLTHIINWRTNWPDLVPHIPLLLECGSHPRSPVKVKIMIRKRWDNIQRNLFSIYVIIYVYHTVISVISSLCYLSLSIARVGPFVAGVFPLPGQVNEIKLPHFIVSVKQKNMSKYIFFKSVF